MRTVIAGMSVVYGLIAKLTAPSVSSRRLKGRVPIV